MECFMSHEKLLRKTKQQLENLRSNGKILKYPKNFNENIFKLAKIYSPTILATNLNMAKSSLFQIIKFHFFHYLFSYHC